MGNQLYQIALTQFEGIGSKLTKSIVSYAGGVEEVFQMSEADMRRVPGISDALVQKLLNSERALSLAENELKYIQKHHIDTYFYLDEAYPQRLLMYDDCPVILYKKGNAALNPDFTLGIIGTRDATQYGLAVVERIVGELLPYNITIISGLAYGIDSQAHRMALKNGLPTIGIMGTGHSMIYPSDNESMAKKMTKNGALLTELTHLKGPNREHFPMRNRIIAGMCDGVLVVETAQKGGSMITANLALGYNKDLFAVPGRITDPFSKGCNFLIRNHRATPIQSGEDIIRAMNWDVNPIKRAAQAQLFVELNRQESELVELLKKHSEMNIDKLGFQLGLSPSQLSTMVLELELKGIIRSMPGSKVLLTQ